MFSDSRDKAIVALYRAKNPRELATAFFEFFSEIIPNHSQIFIFSSNSSTTEKICSRPEEELSWEGGILDTAQEDVLFNCGLENPLQLFTRKSKSHSKKVLRLSQIYRPYMAKTGVDHAVTLFSGRPDAWQACLTIFRTQQQGQGDFSEQELKSLQAFRPYLQSTIERVVGQGEGELTRKTLEMFNWSLPSALIVLSWDMKVLYYNASALELSECWKSGTRFSNLKKSNVMHPPADIVALIERQKALLPTLMLQTRTPQKALFLSEMKPSLSSDFKAKVYFYPHNSLTLNGGTFLVSLHRQSAEPDEQQTYNGLASLSPRERDVVLLAAQGKKSAEIGIRLGTAPITVRMQLCSAYKKLGINTRYELMSLFPRHFLSGEISVHPEAKAESASNGPKKPSSPEMENSKTATSLLP